MVRPLKKNSAMNISLIGMPGAGKSTVGPVLARMLGLAFLDTDTLIEAGRHKALQEIVDEDGRLALQQLEEETVLGLQVSDQVIATGGSVIYSTRAMEHLRASSTLIFLDLPLAGLEKRLGNFAARGIVRKAGQTLAGLYQERRPLYQRYADLIISCDHRSPEEIAGLIIGHVRGKA